MNSPSYVLDTNVILHDPRAHYSFSNGKVIIPITVLEELDKFKSGNDQKSMNARHFIRDIETERHDWLEIDLVSTVNDLEVGSDVLKGYLNDNRILACAFVSRSVLVTKDINLRMKAEAFDIEAQDYSTDKVKDVEGLLRTTKMVEVTDADLMTGLFKEPEGIPYEDDDLKSNEYFILKNGRALALVKYDGKSGNLRAVKSKTVMGITPKNAEQTFAVDALTDDSIPLVAMTGKAGTGKTLLALASAIASKKNYTQIFLSRPTVDMEREIGFLPGTMEEKLSPYLMPYEDNFKFIKEVQKTQKTKDGLDKLKAEGKIQIEALNYIRGRSLPRVYFIIDESQNLTPHEVKTIITRAGEGAKLIFMGDLDQIDTPYLDKSSNGLAYMIDKMSGQDLFAHVKLVKGERSELAELASDLL